MRNRKEDECMNHWDQIVYKLLLVIEISISKRINKFCVCLKDCSNSYLIFYY